MSNFEKIDISTLKFEHNDPTEQFNFQDFLSGNSAIDTLISEAMKLKEEKSIDAIRQLLYDSYELMWRLDKTKKTMRMNRIMKAKADLIFYRIEFEFIFISGETPDGEEQVKKFDITPKRFSAAVTHIFAKLVKGQESNYDYLNGITHGVTNALVDRIIPKPTILKDSTTVNQAYVYFAATSGADIAMEFLPHHVLAYLKLRQMFPDAFGINKDLKETEPSKRKAEVMNRIWGRAGNKKVNGMDMATFLQTGETIERIKKLANSFGKLTNAGKQIDKQNEAIQQLLGGESNHADSGSLSGASYHVVDMLE